MNPIEELEQYLRDRFDTAITGSDALPDQTLKIDEPITEREAEFFLKGLKQAVFSIDNEGYVQSSLLPPPPQNSSKQRMIQMFWNHGGGIKRLFREGVNQMATACRLVFEYGWQVDEIKMEPSISEFGHLAYGVDIIVVAPNGAIPLCCENKRNSPEFKKLIRQFTSCCSMGKHAREECPNRDNHPKYEFCLNSRARFIWLVSPMDETCFGLSYADGGLIQLTELHELPSRVAVLSN